MGAPSPIPLFIRVCAPSLLDLTGGGAVRASHGAASAHTIAGLPGRAVDIAELLEHEQACFHPAGLLSCVPFFLGPARERRDSDASRRRRCGWRVVEVAVVHGFPSMGQPPRVSARRWASARFGTRSWPRRARSAAARFAGGGRRFRVTRSAGARPPAARAEGVCQWASASGYFMQTRRTNKQTSCRDTGACRRCSRIGRLQLRPIRAGASRSPRLPRP